jgi:hypothetical protein
MHLTAFVERGYASSVRMSRGIQIPEYVLQGCLAAFKSGSAELFVLKSRTENDARKEDAVILALISRTNFGKQFRRSLETHYASSAV